MAEIRGLPHIIAAGDLRDCRIVAAMLGTFGAMMVEAILTTLEGE